MEYEYEGKLTEDNHREMDAFLANVLDWYKTGEIPIGGAVAGLAHVMAALDIDNTEEAVAWFKEANKTYFGG
jgi:hypothetical protein